MGSPAVLPSHLSSPSTPVALISPPLPSSKPSLLPFNPQIPFILLRANIVFNSSHKPPSQHILKLQNVRTGATLSEGDSSSSPPLVVLEEQEEQCQPISTEVEESVKVLKNAARTRKIAAEEVLASLAVIEKAKVDPSGFLETLGGSESPGRTWMLIFTAEKQLKGGRYFPLTAVQRFDAAGKRIENGVYLGPIGCLTFEGRFSWKKRILAFIFELIRIRIGTLKPFEISLGQKDDREPSGKDPLFIWFYIDEEIAVARGRSGGTAFWCRCSRVST